MKKIWALLDDRAGNNAQVLGVAEKLGVAFEKKQVMYTPLAKLPNFLKFNSLLGIQNKDEFHNIEFPDLILSCGRKLAPVALYIKKHAAKNIKLVHFLNPEISHKDFDLIVYPEHDKAILEKNVIEILGAPNKITPQFLEEEQNKWLEKFKLYKRPYITVLVGGSNKHGEFTENEAKELGTKISAMAEAENATILITTSRRTTHKVKEVLKSNINTQNLFYFYDYEQNQENPYFGLLALADKIIITADSIAMISESLMTEKPVYVFETLQTISAKHRRFLDKIYGEHYAYNLVEKQDYKLNKFPDEALKICQKIRDLFL
jgi:mitochondrial fission protein ELM1